MATKWLENLKSAQKTCLVQDGRRKVHVTFQGGHEMVEEYDVTSNELVVRKWKKKVPLGGDGKWEFEVGEQPGLRTGIETEGLVESSSNPVVVRKDTKKSFQWRVRNLPYPLSTYDVKVDGDCKNIIIRTTNKKYYKKFSIPDMERAGILLCQDNISIAHSNNTLIVTYSKPAEILDLEKEVQTELKKMNAEKDGDVQCGQQ